MAMGAAEKVASLCVQRRPWSRHPGNTYSMNEFMHPFTKYPRRSVILTGRLHPHSSLEKVAQVGND